MAGKRRYIQFVLWNDYIPDDILERIPKAKLSWADPESSPEPRNANHELEICPNCNGYGQKSDAIDGVTWECTVCRGTGIKDTYNPVINKGPESV